MNISFEFLMNQHYRGDSLYIAYILIAIKIGTVG